MANNPYLQSEIDRNSRFLRRYQENKNPTAQDNKYAQYVKKRYGSNFYNTRQFDPDKVGADVRGMYTKANPLSDYTKDREMRYLKRIDDMQQNNQGVSGVQKKQYDSMKQKWNYQSPDERVMTYQEAQQRAGNQLDPLYKKAAEKIRTEQFLNQRNLNQDMTGRGLTDSGIAADQSFRLAMATQGQLNDQEVDRTSKVAEYAQALVDKDQSRVQELQRYRDAMKQQEIENAFRERSYRDELKQRGIDNAFRDRNYADDKKWREYTFNNMSASDKAQLAWAKSQFGEDMAWKMFALKYQGELDKSMAEYEIDSYTQPGFLEP